jgi:exonuclease SbcC
MGKSDSGKTAIKRALEWVITNRPSGDAFRSNWGGTTAVTITLDNAVSIIRMKNDSENGYSLTTPDEMQKAFKAFGQDVPEEIKAALNMLPVNIQGQFDKPFLLDSSSGEVAAHFNKIAHIDQIDTSIRNIQSWIKKLEQDIKAKEIQLTDAQEDEKKFEYLENFEIEVEVIEQLQSSFTQTANAKNKLSELITFIVDNNKKIEENSDILLIESDLDSILWNIDVKDACYNQLDKLTDLLQSIELINLKMEETQILAELEIPVVNLLELYAEKTTITKQKNTISGIIEEIHTTQSSIVSQQSKVERLENQYASQYPDICPFCNNRVKKTI